MEQIILVVHVLAALAIIGLILVQQGKGADMGASFGAGASQTLFGSDGSGNVLTRATAILATLFFVTSLSLAYVAKQRSVVGEDIRDRIGFASEVFDVLGELKVNVELISFGATRINLSFLVGEGQAADVVRGLHKRLFES